MEKSLRDLIARLPIPGLRESTDRHTIADALTQSLTISIRPHQIQVKEGFVTVSVPPVVKSAIQIRQHELKELLTKEGVSVVGFR